MQVRKKLDILEAFRFGIDAVPEWFQEMIKKNDAYITTHDAAIIRVTVNEEAFWADVKQGYVIVKDLCGVVYPVEPAVFGMMFEVVER